MEGTGLCMSSPEVLASLRVCYTGVQNIHVPNRGGPATSPRARSTPKSRATATEGRPSAASELEPRGRQSTRTTCLTSVLPQEDCGPSHTHTSCSTSLRAHLLHCSSWPASCTNQPADSLLSIHVQS